MSGRGTPRRNPLRATLLTLRYHVDHAADEVAKAIRHDVDGEELTTAIKALRTIANADGSDKRSKGVAVAALRKMRLSR